MMSYAKLIFFMTSLLFSQSGLAVSVGVGKDEQLDILATQRQLFEHEVKLVTMHQSILFLYELIHEISKQGLPQEERIEEYKKAQKDYEEQVSQYKTAKAKLVERNQKWINRQREVTRWKNQYVTYLMMHQNISLTDIDRKEINVFIEHLFTSLQIEPEIFIASIILSKRYLQAIQDRPKTEKKFLEQFLETSPTEKFRSIVSEAITRGGLIRGEIKVNTAWFFFQEFMSKEEKLSRTDSKFIIKSQSETPNFIPTTRAICRLIVVFCMIASKSEDDLSCCNADFYTCSNTYYPELFQSLKELNILERYLLDRLKWKTTITREEFDSVAQQMSREF